MNAVNTIADLARPNLSDDFNATIRAAYVPGIIGYRTLARMFDRSPQEIQEIIHDKKIISERNAAENQICLSPERIEATRVVSTVYDLEQSGKLVGKKLWHFHMRLWQRYHFTLSYKECTDIVEALLQEKVKPIKISGDKSFYAVEHPDYNRGPLFILVCTYGKALVTVAHPSCFKKARDGQWIMKQKSFALAHYSEPAVPHGRVHAPQYNTLAAA